VDSTDIADVTGTIAAIWSTASAPGGQHRCFSGQSSVCAYGSSTSSTRGTQTPVQVEPQLAEDAEVQAETGRTTISFAATVRSPRAVAVPPS
jgi:hypothetical protein